ncbi:hypothetical protein [Haliscomenobacter hydrossis]|uniref:Uncharacterized protein n=1 Tax=Haliscomenobacter hydrossis (strain ATCC 27775 / DSM 1100 / LMG 10767 / O) TaxID=760192 RepID=F4L7V4_HALH1|nr:hypothetical protein [Haliscomenobacter hydrossis]AEE54462.1 hypothetical protein Halhy_6646 [Haliscomenobacter hydrossis DSM 1100]
MAKMPIEIITVSERFQFLKELRGAIDYANDLQEDFFFELLAPAERAHFEFISFDKVRHSREVLQSMDTIRKQIKGFHPFLILVVESELETDNLANIFGSAHGKKGLALFTTSNVAVLIVPEDKMMAYFLYYLARYTLNFINPLHKGHLDQRGCVYDKKTLKTDLLKSMKNRALCSECESMLISAGTSMTINQFFALNKIFAASGEILQISDLIVKKNQIKLYPDSKKIEFEGRIEIKFEPLLLAIYLLFLHNEDGIKLDELDKPIKVQGEEHDGSNTKYEKHLKTVFSIHDKLIPRHKRDNEKNKYNFDMIEFALGPRRHEKFAKINRIIKDKFMDDLIAQQFLILGSRSEPKRIEAAKFIGCKEYVDQIIKNLITVKNARSYEEPFLGDHANNQPDNNQPVGHNSSTSPKTGKKH